MKKIICLMFSIIIIISTLSPVKALTEEDYASKLKEIGVFKGTSLGFELDRAPTRLEGLIMLVRLLGKEEAAMSEAKGASVFADVPGWGIAYTNYAYKNGLTTGIGNGLFGSNDLIDARSYLTFILRALGYNDKNGDFTWENAVDDAATYKVIGINLASKLNEVKFIRGNVAECSYLALKSTIKDSDTTLIQKLVNDGLISQELANGIGLIDTDKVSDVLQIHYINVGQGDAILVINGQDTLLIDAGGNDAEDTVVNYIKSQGIHQLDYVVGTHPHEDHIGGLDAVINIFDTEVVMMPKVTSTTKTFEDVIDAVNARKLSVTVPVVSKVYTLGDASFTILAPNDSNYTDLNNYSIVIRLVDGENSFLFTGDAESKSEKEMIQKSLNLQSDVLKLGHHGSSSSTLTILSVVKPQYAVVSVGKGNNYGHPTAEVLNKLEQLKIPIFRTDESGTVIASSDGSEINFNVVPGSYTPGGDGTGVVDESNDITNSTSDSTPASGIIIAALDKQGEIITIKNTGTTALNLQGYYIISVRGNQKYIFPSYTLKNGESVTVASGTTAGLLKWGSSNVWNNTESDPAEFYNPNGMLIDTYEN